MLANRTTKVLFLILVTFAILSAAVKAIDDDSFDLYRDSSDDGFEETTQEPEDAQTKNIETETNQAQETVAEVKTETSQEEPSKAQDQEDNTDPTPSYQNEAGTGFVEESSSQTPPQNQKPQNTRDLKPNNDKKFETSKVSEQKQNDNSKKMEDLYTIVCLAMYSKSALDKVAFQNHLESLFTEAMIDDHSIKTKLVERYIVNAVYNCEQKTTFLEQASLQNMMRDQYTDKLDEEYIRKYIIYDDNLIKHNQPEMSKEEMVTSEKMKKIQKEYGQSDGKGDNKPNEQKAVSMTETYGEYSLLIIAVVALCILFYLCQGRGKREQMMSSEQHIKDDLRNSKVERGQQIEREKELKEKVQKLKDEINMVKKAK